jgi:hypothetical protein
MNGYRNAYNTKYSLKISDLFGSYFLRTSPGGGGGGVGRGEEKENSTFVCHVASFSSSSSRWCKYFLKMLVESISCGRVFGLAKCLKMWPIL